MFSIDPKRADIKKGTTVNFVFSTLYKRLGKGDVGGKGSTEGIK